MAEEDHGEFVKDTIDKDDPRAEEMSRKIFSFPVYTPHACFTNIVQSPTGEWMGILCYQVPREGEEDYSLNIAMPTDVAESILRDAADQIARFRERGGHKNAN
jgi:hypothetical protein